MKKIILTTIAVLSVNSILAQENDSFKKWNSAGNFALLANQSSFTNWQAGGNNNFAGTLNLNYDLNYQNDGWSLDNKLQVNYGINKLKGEGVQKTDDRLEINSLLGKLAFNDWNYSFFVNFKTQMHEGVDSKTKVRNSHFFSPAYLKLGPGFLWKKSDNFKINIAPITSKFIFVSDEFTKKGTAFGVKEGKTVRYEIGASVSGYYKFNLLENVSMENILSLYADYLDRPKNVDIDYQLNLVFKINRHLSANINFQAIYDDNAFKGFQIKETVGLGVNYTF